MDIIGFLLYLLAGTMSAKIAFWAHAPGEPPITTRVFSFVLWPVFFLMILHAMVFPKK